MNENKFQKHSDALTNLYRLQKIEGMHRTGQILASTALTPILGTNHYGDYDKLPEVLKWMFTKNEYRWMTDEQRDNLEWDECLPDWGETWE